MAKIAMKKRPKARITKSLLALGFMALAWP
jgi:hypothetical protein